MTRCRRLGLTDVVSVRPRWRGPAGTVAHQSVHETARWPREEAELDGGFPGLSSRPTTRVSAGARRLPDVIAGYTGCMRGHDHRSLDGEQIMDSPRQGSFTA